MKTKKIKPITITIAIAIIIIALIASVFLVNYFIGKNNFFSKSANKMLPFPVAIVGANDLISGKLLADNLTSSRRFYEKQDFSKQGIRIDFSTGDGKQRLSIKEKNILNKMIENAIVKKMLKEKGIKVTDEMISQEVDRKILEMGNGAEIQERLFQLYGWNLEKFKERIVRPDLERSKLAEKVLAEEKYFEKTWEKIKLAEEKIKENQNFGDIAKEFSEGESAKTSGDLGWFSEEQMLPEISTVIFTMKKGEVSEIIQSQLGLHIVKVEDEKIENSIPMVKVSQVFIRTPSFADWLIKEGTKISVKIMVADYDWNSEKLQLEFKDANMKKLEDDLLNNFQGDVSVFF